MFSTCSELTPRAPIPDGRIERIMQPVIICICMCISILVGQVMSDHDSDPWQLQNNQCYNFHSQAQTIAVNLCSCTSQTYRDRSQSSFYFVSHSQASLAKTRGTFLLLLDHNIIIIMSWLACKIYKQSRRTADRRESDRQAPMRNIYVKLSHTFLHIHKYQMGRTKYFLQVGKILFQFGQIYLMIQTNAGN